MSSGTADLTRGGRPDSPPDAPVLSVAGLTTRFRTHGGDVTAVDGVSFDLYAGETLAIVGESGSGKSVTVMSLMGLVAAPAGRVVAGSVMFGGRDLLRVPERELRRIRGQDLAMVFQDPMSSLNPVISVGRQIQEALRLHNRKMTAGQTRQRTVELLAEVGLSAPEESFRQYPHQYSGGMRQRVLIAMSMANRPKVLIADEPTTALDVTIQAQILRVLRKARDLTNAATILITHDLGLVAELADRVMVMYGGKVVESADVSTIFYQPRHPYTIGLLASRPRLDRDVQKLRAIRGQPPNFAALPSGCSFQPRCDLQDGRAICREQAPELLSIGTGHRSACHFAADLAAGQVGDLSDDTAEPATEDHANGQPGSRDTAAAAPPSGREILSVDNLSKQFVLESALFRREPRRVVNAVNGVSLALHQGETLGVVGETGCGKSTTGRMIMRILEPSGGTILLKGRDISHVPPAEMPEIRRNIQIVFQDPYSSLDPRMRVRDIISEPLRINHIGDRDSQQQRVSDLLELVGLSPDHASRYPHQFSGGQRQRIGIARALAMEPEVLILDEPVSALDVSLQAQIINLLNALKARLHMSYLFISHDLSMVRYLCDTVAVMYSGQIMESGPADRLFANPVHPYTQALLSSVPIPDPDQRGRRDRIVLEGDVKRATELPRGCIFQDRCFKVTSKCRDERPVLDLVEDGHRSACHYPSARNLLQAGDASATSETG
jgi:peptide/nickel transport system ATP-binding protein